MEVVFHTEELKYKSVKSILLLKLSLWFTKRKYDFTSQNIYVFQSENSKFLKIIIRGYGKTNDRASCWTGQMYKYQRLIHAILSLFYRRRNKKGIQWKNVSNVEKLEGTPCFARQARVLRVCVCDFRWRPTCWQGENTTARPIQPFWVNLTLLDESGLMTVRLRSRLNLIWRENYPLEVWLNGVNRLARSGLPKRQAK